MSRPAAHAAAWNALYEKGYRALALPDYLLETPVPPGGRILDIGCGQGEHAEALARRWGASGFGVDTAWEALRLGVPGRTALADGQRLPVSGGTLDLVYSLGVLEHLEKPETVLAECFRALKSGGWTYHSVPHRWSVWTALVRPAKRLAGRWRVGPERSFSAKGLAGLFGAAGFRAVEWRLAPFSAYDCYGAIWPLEALYRLEDALAGFLPGVGFFLHMRGRKP